MKTLAYWMFLCSLAVSAHAVDPGGYWTLFGGWSKAKDSYLILEDSTGNVSPTMLQYAYEESFQEGWAGGIAFGRRYEQHFRFEFEMAGRYHRLGDLVTLETAPLPAHLTPVPDPTGHLWSVGGSVNAFVDLYHCCPFFIPFLGGGAGYTYIKFKDIPTLTQWGAHGDSQGDFGFHWQLFGGVTILEDDCRRAFVRYRYKEIYPDILYNLQGGYQLRAHARSHAIEAGISFTYY